MTQITKFSNKKKPTQIKEQAFQFDDELI